MKASINAKNKFKKSKLGELETKFQIFLATVIHVPKSCIKMSVTHFYVH